MKNLLSYIWRVFKWTFSGADAIAKTGGVIALYVVGFQVPQLRWEYLAVATALLVLNATFAVWNEERKRADNLSSKLDEAKSAIPVYQIGSAQLKNSL
jgi:hypothetical protein